MDTLQKLQLLSEHSQYDLACSCGTRDQEHRKRTTDGHWLYPVSLPNGGQSLMLKTLMSNACSNDCKYCPLRQQTNIRRCSLAPEEVARVFVEYAQRMNLYGLFLSSGMLQSPDHTMDQLVAAAQILRRQYQYRGYIHLKVIPGASDAAIESAIAVASAVSINIETPGEQHCRKLSGQKHFLDDIIRPLKLISRLTARGERHHRVRKTTQFIVGASDETDSEIVHYMFGLYQRLGLNRVYFSAYQPGLGSADIPGEKPGLNPNDRLTREHRLYQADFLIRKYGFNEQDFYFDQNQLNLDRDPKEVWAERHAEFFPVSIQRADREALLRVPGLGLITVNRILKQRRQQRFRSLSDLGPSHKRLHKAARYLTFD